MPGAYLYGFDVDTGERVKIKCTDEGKLIIDPTLILEDTPTENESTKAPTSKWAFAHKALSSAHHTKFTAANARAAINNIFGSDGRLNTHFYADNQYIRGVKGIYFSGQAAIAELSEIRYIAADAQFSIWAKDNEGAYQDFVIRVYVGGSYTNLTTEVYVDSKVAIVKGTHYWSCSGIHFDPLTPSAQNVTKDITGKLIINENTVYCQAAVFLPHGCTVTNVIVYGNAGAEDDNWYLRRFTLSNETEVTLSSAAFNTADATINYATIDNNLYVYFLTTSQLVTTDEIWGACITYTL